MDPLRREAAQARQLVKSHPTVENRATYLSACNKYLHLITTEKTNSWRCYLSTLTLNTLLQAKRFAGGPRTSPSISNLIKKDGTIFLSNKDKAQTLFSATCVATEQCDLNNIPQICFPRPLNTTATYLPKPSLFFSKASIHESLTHTCPMKSSGPDGIQNWVWLPAWEGISQHITALLKAIIKQGFIPPRWKTAKTTMLAKPGKDDYTLPRVYRPIALLNTIGKLFEKTLTKYLSYTSERNNVLHPSQYRARPGRSSQDALIHLVSWIKKQ